MITTHRLRISQFTAEDAPFIRELLNSPPWLNYIGDRNIHSDFGFAFLPDYLGQGYGYEAACACLAYGLEKHGVKEVLAITQENNLPSIGLLQKLGFREDGMVKWPGDEQELMLFRLVG